MFTYRFHLYTYLHRSTMAFLPYPPFLLPLLPLTIPSDLYNPLRNKPTRPTSSWNPLAYLQYQFHRAYFYLVTEPGYVLDPAECRFLDAFILILLGVIYYIISLILPIILVLNWAVLRTVLFGEQVEGGSTAGYAISRAVTGTIQEGAYLWDEGVKQGVFGLWSLGQAGLGAAGNATASPRAV